MVEWRRGRRALSAEVQRLGDARTPSPWRAVPALPPPAASRARAGHARPRVRGQGVQRVVLPRWPACPGAWAGSPVALRGPPGFARGAGSRPARGRSQRAECSGRGLPRELRSGGLAFGAYPTDSKQMATPFDISRDLSPRLSAILLLDDEGRRFSCGGDHRPWSALTFMSPCSSWLRPWVHAWIRPPEYRTVAPIRRARAS
jgi:hypothetical protein